MRRSKIAILASVASLFVVSSPAFAQTFSLNATSHSGGAITFNGASIDLAQTIGLNCRVAVVGTVVTPASNNIAVTSQTISAGNVFCGVLVYPYLPSHPWKIEAVNATGQLVRVFVSANTTTNKPCAGWINTKIEADKRTVKIVNAVLPPITTGDPTCSVNGNIVADKDLFVR